MATIGHQTELAAREDAIPDVEELQGGLRRSTRGRVRVPSLNPTFLPGNSEP